jgi:S-adenosylmethionine synthetase
VDEFRDVVVVELKIRQGKEVLDVFELARNEVIHANDMTTVVDKALAKVGTQKAGCAGD